MCCNINTFDGENSHFKYPHASNSSDPSAVLKERSGSLTHVSVWDGSGSCLDIRHAHPQSTMMYLQGQGHHGAVASGSSTYGTSG